MAVVSVKDLLESGVHFGHRVSRWHPKMERYIFGKRNLIHIIDLRETLKGLLRAQNFLHRLCADGKEVLIVGTKRQARAVIEAQAKRCGMPFVSERWLGGTLTNFETITKRLERLAELEQQEETGAISLLTKKELARFNREKRKLLRNLGGIRHMKRLPGAVVIVDPRREHIALQEAYKLGIPSICLIDTDSDPSLVDIAIPGNDDAMRSIEVILRHLTEAILTGVKIARTAQGIDVKKRAEDGEVEPQAPAAAKRVVVRRAAPAKPPAEPKSEAPPEAGKKPEPEAQAEKQPEPEAEKQPEPAPEPEPAAEADQPPAAAKEEEAEPAAEPEKEPAPEDEKEKE